MDFATLKANVNDAMGRTDIPSFVYTLMMADINSDVRVLEMQAQATLTAGAEAVSLPGDFMAVESLYTDTGGSRTRLVPITEQSQAVKHDSSGRPYYYSVHKGEITLMPVPSGSYDISLRYYAKMADFSADADTNDTIARYPALFLYNALTHAAVWAKDTEGAMTYDKAYKGALDRAKRVDLNNRMSGPITQRSGR